MTVSSHFSPVAKGKWVLFIIISSSSSSSIAVVIITKISLGLKNVLSVKILPLQNFS